MERRDVLKSASALAAASTVGLAGCNGILGGDDGNGSGGGGNSCDTPGENLEDSFPSGDYELQGSATTSDGSGQENVERTASGFLVGPDGGEFIFSVNEFSSSGVASDEAANASDTEQGDFQGAFGYLQTGAYVFVAGGSDKDSVTALMKASPTLSDSCVDNNLQFFGSAANSLEFSSN
jgi:hypothetical protein